MVLFAVMFPRFTLMEALVLGSLLGAPALASAQGVYKCTDSGKTVYQAAPCAHGGSTVTLRSGPTEDQWQDAKRRANADKARAAQVTARATQPQAPVFVGKRYDCNALNQQRAEAFGRRNATLRESRRTNIDQSSAISNDYDRIHSIESQMVKGGCKPN